VTTTPLLFHIVLQILAKAIKQEEEVKRIQIGKQTVKISLFTNDMILYVKDPRNSTPKLLDTISSYSKVTAYKINLEKSFAFLYTNNGNIKRRMYGNNSIYNSLKKKKKPRNKTKNVNDLYKGNYKALKKEIQEDYIRWKDLPC
jgi:hypothetical protein